MKHSPMMGNPEIPLGLSMALAENRTAMQHFANLTPQQQREVIAGTHSIASSADMRAYVQQRLGKGEETKPANFLEKNC